MDIRKILSDLRRERGQLDHAIAAIESLSSSGQRFGRRGRRGAVPQGATAELIPRRGRMSAAARRKLSAMMKARWAAGKMGKRKSRTVK